MSHKCPGNIGESHARVPSWHFRSAVKDKCASDDGCDVIYMVMHRCGPVPRLWNAAAPMRRPSQRRRQLLRRRSAHGRKGRRRCARRWCGSSCSSRTAASCSTTAASCRRVPQCSRKQVTTALCRHGHDTMTSAVNLPNCYEAGHIARSMSTYIVFAADQGYRHAKHKPALVPCSCHLAELRNVWPKPQSPLPLTGAACAAMAAEGRHCPLCPSCIQNPESISLHRSWTRCCGG